MRLRTVLVVALVLLPAVGFAQTKKKKPSVPAVFGNAKYVYVKAEDGDMYNPRLLPEDRDAISDVMNALHAWGRYIVMPTDEGAELVFIVRKGRVASARAGVTVGTQTTPGSTGAGPYPGNPRQTGAGVPGTTFGGEVGPPDDFLEVRMKNPGGDLSGPVWQRTMTDGLDAPNVPLLQTLRQAVERDYPQK
jgi:hypothetical protein